MRRVFATFLIVLLCLCACAEKPGPDAGSTQPSTASTTARATETPTSAAGLYTTAAPQTTNVETTVASTSPATTSPPQTTVPPTTAPPVEPQTDSVSLVITCKIGVDSGNISQDKLDILPEDGIILRVENAELLDGDTVFDLLVRECRANRVHLEFVTTPGLGSAYIEGIGNLYELDGGPLSGWVFTVNGGWPGSGSSAVTLSPGDAVEWIYTTDLGRDVGAPDAALGG